MPVVSANSEDGDPPGISLKWHFQRQIYIHTALDIVYRAHIKSQLKESHSLIFSLYSFWVSVHYRRGRDDHVAQFDDITAKGKWMSSERQAMGDAEQFCSTR